MSLVAVKIYQRKLLKTTFSALKTNWHNEKVQWRYILRANIHYKLALKRKVLLNWQCFALRKKEKALKCKLCELYYLQKIKRRYLLYLKYQPQFNRAIRGYNTIVCKYATYLLLCLNLIIKFRECYSSRVECFSLILRKLYFQKRIQKTCFKSWYFYKEARLVLKNKQRMGLLFFKLKHSSEDVRVYFQNWKNFTRYSIQNRINGGKVRQYINAKLKRKYFKNLRRYVKKRKRCASNKMMADIFLRRKLMGKTLRKWKIFKLIADQKASKIQKANEFYVRNLKRKSVAKIYIYTARKRRLEQLYFILSQNVDMKLKRKYLILLKGYLLARREKWKKRELAQSFYRSRLMKRTFEALRKFQEEQQKILAKLLADYKVKLLKMCLAKWKTSTTRSVQKQEKIVMAQKYAQWCLFDHYFKYWKVWTFERKSKRDFYVILEKRYKTKLQQNVFLQWRNHIKNKRSEESEIERQKVVENSLNFEWNPICFQKPRIPKYLEHTIHDYY